MLEALMQHNRFLVVTGKRCCHRVATCNATLSPPERGKPQGVLWEQTEGGRIDEIPCIRTRTRT